MSLGLPCPKCGNLVVGTYDENGFFGIEHVTFEKPDNKTVKISIESRSHMHCITCGAHSDISIIDGKLVIKSSF